MMSEIFLFNPSMKCANPIKETMYSPSMVLGVEH